MTDLIVLSPAGKMYGFFNTKPIEHKSKEFLSKFSEVNQAPKVEIEQQQNLQSSRFLVEINNLQSSRFGVEINNRAVL